LRRQAFLPGGCGNRSSHRVHAAGGGVVSIIICSLTSVQLGTSQPDPAWRMTGRPGPRRRSSWRCGKFRDMARPAAAERL